MRRGRNYRMDKRLGGLIDEGAGDIGKLIRFEQDTIKHARDRIHMLQTICRHPKDKIIKTPNTDRDDFDAPGKGVHYWDECECSDCGKRWKELQ